MTAFQSNTPVRRNETPDTRKPRVDVLEDARGITLFADLPGVNSDRLQIQVDRDTLSIEGTVESTPSEELQVLHREAGARVYRREFALSAELDPDAVQATLRDGVLELRIAKRSELQPRRIEVRVN